MFVTFVDFCQGIPIGLVFCTIPFILKGLDSSSNKSYSELGIFSAASYPYSLKFLWSPIVDSVYLPQVGRRKSWIIPLHAIASGMLFWIGRVLPAMLTPEAIHESVWKLTWLFGGLILVCGTLEIVVDGWALSLLTEKDRKYQSSLCQTIGLNSGYFTSFTLLLSLSSSVLSLSRYIQLFASIYFCSILVVFRMKPEVQYRSYECFEFFLKMNQSRGKRSHLNQVNYYWVTKECSRLSHYPVHTHT